MAFETFTLDFNDSFVEKQFFFISTTPAFTARRTRLSKFETLAIIFLAFGLRACAFSDWGLWRFWIGTCRCWCIGSFQIPCLSFFSFWRLDWHRWGRRWFVIVGEWTFFMIHGFWSEEVEEVGVIFGFKETLDLKHDLLLLHLFVPRLAIHTK